MLWAAQVFRPVPSTMKARHGRVQLVFATRKSIQLQHVPHRWGHTLVFAAVLRRPKMQPRSAPPRQRIALSRTSCGIVRQIAASQRQLRAPRIRGSKRMCPALNAFSAMARARPDRLMYRRASRRKCVGTRVVLTLPAVPHAMQLWEISRVKLDDLMQ